jgi:tetratricopeptide (TPR) repeat protein
VDQLQIDKQIQTFQKYIKIGDTLLDAGKMDEAIAQYTNAMSMLHKLYYSKSHHSIGSVHDRIAQCFALKNDFLQSAKHLEISIEIVKSTFGLFSSESAHELAKLSHVYYNAMYVLFNFFI